MGTRPGENAVAPVGLNRLRGRWSFEFNRALSWYLDLNPFVKHDALMLKIVLEPELAGIKGFVGRQRT